jgi:hypothetical protein
MLQKLLLARPGMEGGIFWLSRSCLLYILEFISSDCHCLGREVFVKGDEVNGIDHSNLIQVWSFGIRVLVLVVRNWDT